MSDKLKFVVIGRMKSLSETLRQTEVCRTLPLNRAFFGSIDLRERWRLAKEKALDVVEKEILRVCVRQVETVMIDDLRLFLQPGGPAGLADLTRYSLAKFVGEGRKAYRRALLATMFALYRLCHGFLLVEGL